MTLHERAKEAAEFLNNKTHIEAKWSKIGGSKLWWAFDGASDYWHPTTDQELIHLAIRNGWRPKGYFSYEEHFIEISPDGQFIEYNDVLYERVEK